MLLLRPLKVLTQAWFIRSGCTPKNFKLHGAESVGNVCTTPAEMAVDGWFFYKDSGEFWDNPIKLKPGVFGKKGAGGRVFQIKIGVSRKHLVGQVAQAFGTQAGVLYISDRQEVFP